MLAVVPYSFGATREVDAMALIVPMRHFDSYTRDDLDYALYETPRAPALRAAASTVVRSIHALPDAMGCDLRQLEVYLGRAGADYGYLRNRWQARFEAFNRAPSTHAMVVVRAPTGKLRDQRWERAGHLIVNALTRNNALCCANALTGDSGAWPDTDECVIYVVARTRKGPAGHGVDDRALHRAMGELLLEDGLDDGVVRDVGKTILHTDDYEPHELLEPSTEEGEDEEEHVVYTCRRDGCDYAALDGNYGFCGKHRSYVPEGTKRCRVCDRAALAGNYGFCGYHRK